MQRENIIDRQDLRFSINPQRFNYAALVKKVGKTYFETFDSVIS